MANAKHGQKICWNLLMSRNLPCIYIYLEYCHIRQNANGKLYMLGNDEIQHFSFHLYDVWGSFDNQNFYKLLTITVLGSADSNRKERVMQPQNRPVDVYLNQFITIQFNGASLRNCVKQKIEFPLLHSIFSARDRTERGIDNAVRR